MSRGGRELTVGIDDNHPFSVGRHVGTGAPDDDEIVTLMPPALSAGGMGDVVRRGRASAGSARW